MKKLVLKLDLHDEKDKHKAMKKVSTIPGVDSIAMDMEGRKLTIVGATDPVVVVKKLRKKWHTDVLTFEEAKKDEVKKEEEEKKKVEDLIKAYNAYYNYPQMGQYFHYAQ